MEARATRSLRATNTNFLLLSLACLVHHEPSMWDFRKLTPTRRQFLIGSQIFETSLKKRVVGYARERVLVWELGPLPITIDQGAHSAHQSPCMQ